MPRPWRIRYSGAKYHVTARGNGRQRIFFGRKDYLRFLDQLTAALEKDRVILYAYVLMPNHYHLFCETPLGNIQKFEQRLNTAYGMYFRYRHRRPGHCLQGRYGAKLVGGDDYIVRLTRYLHLNPVETSTMRKRSVAERQARLKSFEWSSYRGYTSQGPKEAIIDYRWLSLLGRKTEKGCMKAYGRYVEEGIGTEDEILKEAYSASRYAIGDEEFIEEAESDLKAMRLERAVYGDVALPEIRVLPVELIEDAVVREFGIKKADLHFHGHRSGIAKSIAVELCCALGGKSQRAIARHYGYRSDAGVTRQRRTLRRKLTESPSLQRRVARIEKGLSKV